MAWSSCSPKRLLHETAGRNPFSTGVLKWWAPAGPINVLALKRIGEPAFHVEHREEVSKENLELHPT